MLTNRNNQLNQIELEVKKVTQSYQQKLDLISARFEESRKELAQAKEALVKTREELADLSDQLQLEQEKNSGLTQSFILNDDHSERKRKESIEIQRQEVQDLIEKFNKRESSLVKKFAQGVQSLMKKFEQKNERIIEFERRFSQLLKYVQVLENKQMTVYLLKLKAMKSHLSFNEFQH